MFKKNQYDRQFKFSLRKKRGGGGAASFIIGSVLFGALMIAPATLAAETGATPLQPTMDEIVSRASSATEDQLATNKVSVSNVRFDRTDIKESQGLDITYSYDWTAKNLKQGDMLVSDMPDAFTSITKVVDTPFYSYNNQELGKLVLDYNNKKIYTYFTGDIDPNKIYNGTINIATFVNRDHFKEVENHEDVQLNLPDGKTATLPLNVTFDVAANNPELTYVSVYAKESTENPDGSMNVKWATTINKAANQDVDPDGKPVTLNDAIVYLSPDTAEGVDVVFPDEDEERAYSSIKPKYKDNALYQIDKNSIEVFEANIYDSMGYQTTKKLVEGVDYQIIEPSSNPNAYVVEFIGNYASTDKQFVITYGGKVEGDSRNNPTINDAVSDSLIAFYEGPKRYADKYSGNFRAHWAEANISVNNSSVTGGMQDTTGSVTVVHVDASTGKVLKAEDYAKTKDGQEAHDVKQGTEYTTAPEKFEGYKFTTLSYDSAPAQGTVKQQLQRVVYLYVPEDKKGSVDVVHKTTDGQILEAVKPVATDENVGTSYSTEKGTFEGYHFVGMAEESAAADGVVTEGTKHVIYLYEKDVVPEVKKGNVDVTYIAEDGTVLEAKSDVVKDGEIGSKYETEQKEFDGYHYVRMGEYSAERTGQVEEGTKHVVYVYAKDPEVKKGSVDVKYITTTGEVLEDVTSVKDNAPVGEDYTTKEKAFDGYHFVGMDKSSDPATGVVAEGTKHVIYLYEKDAVPEVKKGNVDVTYLAEDGTVLEATSDVVKDGKIGSNYETTKKPFDGYHFTRMGQFSAEATGQVEEGTKHVVYVYAKDPEVKKGSVDVKYITKDGKVLEDVTSVKDSAPVGEDYTTEEKAFDGYHFVGMDKSSDAATGVVAEGTKHVIYVYEKDVTPEEKKGSVDVKYITTTGEVLEDVTSVKDNAPVGEDYTTEEKAFDGYHFVGMDKASDAATGLVAEGTKHVIYVYEKDVTPEVKKGNVDVTYVTEDGQILEKTSDVVKDGEIGSNYETTQKEFAGYHFTRMGQFSAEATGQVEEGTKHVVYVYAKDPEVKKGNVDVTYVTEDGQILEPTLDVVKDGEIGSNYETTQKAFDGYHFTRMGQFSAEATGQVEEGTKHVVYVYAKNPETPVEKKGSVDVKYITKDGKVLEDVTSVKNNAPVGEDYTTEEKAFDGYHFVGMDKSSDAATGLVAEGTKHVIYVYEKDVTPEVKKGNVDVTYVTEDGQILEPTLDVVKDGEIGSNYETTQKEFDGYHFTRMGQFSAEATGQVEEGTKHVVYVYAKNPETPVEKKGSVDVKYITKDGKVLEDVTSVKDNAPVGEDYTTEEKSFDGYHFVGMDKTSDPATGVVAEGTKHVIYVYEKDVTPEEKKGNVDVTYVTEDGQILEPTLDVVKDGEIGSNYETTQKEFAGYHFTRMGQFSAEATGQVEEGTKHVVYVYAKDPEVKKGSVDVKYITTTGEVLEDVTSVKDNAPVGEDYTTEEKAFDGYHFVGMDKTSDAATGVVAEGTKHVIYVYEKDVTPEEKKGSVDVKYVDRATGEVLPFDEATLTTIKDNVPEGEGYNTAKKDFSGYTFAGMTTDSAAANGTVVADTTLHVIYAYDKITEPVVERGSVDVVYVDEQGNVLPGGELSDVKKDAPVGETYTTEQKPFEGYTFQRMGTGSALANGEVTKGIQHVIYVYTKNPEAPKTGSVDVKFVDKTNGEIIEGTSLEVVKDGVPVGEGYYTTPKDLTEKGYQFVGVREGSDDPAGLIVEGTKHVVYEYEKIPEPIVKKGSVDVKYVDRATGEVLPFDEAVLTTIKDNAPEGEVYNTAKKDFSGYTFAGMTTDSASANGTVVADTTLHVIYAYDKIPVPEVHKGSVTVVYVDKEGNPLPGGEESTVKDNVPVGEDYSTEEKTFDGYHFVGMDKHSDPVSGKVTEGTKHVIYVYDKDVVPEVHKGSVTVVYVDKEGNPLPGGEESTVKDNVPVGEEYSTEEKTFDGYHFVGMDKHSDPVSGKVTEGTKHVIYVYDKDVVPEVHKGSVTVVYVDKEGNPLPGGEESTVKDNVPVGEDYSTEEKTFDGYHFVGMDKHSDPVSGKVTEGTKHVIYVYDKDVVPEVRKGSVDVKYVTVDGEVLQDVTKVKDQAPVGEKYSTDAKTFDGYQLVGLDVNSAAATGQVIEGDLHVVYIYTKVTSDVPNNPTPETTPDEPSNPTPETTPETTPDEPSNPTPETTPETTPDEPNNSTPETPTPDEPSNPTPETPRHPGLPNTGQPGKPVVPTSYTPQNNGQTSTTTEAKRGHLPKTGSEDQSTQKVIGLATLSMAGLLGFLSKRRKKENE